MKPSISRQGARSGADTSAIEGLKTKLAAFQAEHARIASLTDLMLIVGIAFGAVGLAHALAAPLSAWFGANVSWAKTVSLHEPFVWVVMLSTAMGLALSFTRARRLEGAGLRMQWEVDDLPPLPWLNPPDALQVLRIVQEVLTNVLKHAQARTVRIATRLAGDHVQVQIEDDGCGFEADLIDRESGRGLRHLVQRAARLDGRVTIDSRTGRGTCVTLDLPLQRGTRP